MAVAASSGGHRHIGFAELVAIVAFWTFMAALTAANALLDPRGRGLQPVVASAPILLAFAEAYLWAALTVVIFHLSSRLTVDRAHWLPRVLLFLAIGVVVAIFVDVVVGQLRVGLFERPMRRLPPPTPWFRVRHLWFVNDLVVYMAVLAAGFARTYFLRYRARQEESALLTAQLAEARLASLRAQLDPHFLFNTLHAVSALVESDPRGARRMISRLSDLLRYTLDGAAAQEVPLEREVAVIEQYLDIMRIRFGGRVEMELTVDPAARRALVPSLLLQPLVENALKHGLDKSSGAGHVRVDAVRSGERIVLRVRDTGPGLPSSGVPAAGVGLTNTRARLEQLYGANQSLTLTPAAGGGLEVAITLPYRPAPGAAS